LYTSPRCWACHYVLGGNFVELVLVTEHEEVIVGDRAEGLVAAHLAYMAVLPYMGQMKPVLWVGSSRKNLRACPEAVQDTFGFALYLAQIRAKHPQAKPLKGFGSADVLEVVEDDDGDTYRAVYTVRFANAVYVLHVFQKKAKRGAATPKAEVDLIRKRLRDATADAKGQKR
jgi:phage-related protein